jgi:hypothetical protein
VAERTSMGQLGVADHPIPLKTTPILPELDGFGHHQVDRIGVAEPPSYSLAVVRPHPYYFEVGLFFFSI